MPAPVRRADRPHARLYCDWLDLPAFRALSPQAVSLLVHMLARHRPGENGRLSWSVRRIADALQSSKDTASKAMDELEANGWVAVAEVGRFGHRARSSRYRLTMFTDAEGTPATMDFMLGSGTAKIGGR
jgi:DNA-binding transcriptional MocR family regulator